MGRSALLSGSTPTFGATAAEERTLDNQLPPGVIDEAGVLGASSFMGRISRVNYYVDPTPSESTRTRSSASGAIHLVRRTSDCLEYRVTASLEVVFSESNSARKQRLPALSSNADLRLARLSRGNVW